MPHLRLPLPRRFPRVSIPLALLIFASCSSIQVDSRAAEGWDELRPTTYAWGNSRVADPELSEEIRAAIAERLVELGLEPVDRSEASVLVAYSVAIRAEHKENDPLFDYYTAEQFERGTLTIALLDPDTRVELWRGTGGSKLRRSAVLVGPFATELTPSHEVRNWRIPEKVEAIMNRLRKEL